MMSVGKVYRGLCQKHSAPDISGLGTDIDRQCVFGWKFAGM